MFKIKIFIIQSSSDICFILNTMLVLLSLSIHDTYQLGSSSGLPYPSSWQETVSSDNPCLLLFLLVFLFFLTLNWSDLHETIGEIKEKEVHGVTGDPMQQPGLAWASCWGSQKCSQTHN